MTLTTTLSLTQILVFPDYLSLILLPNIGDEDSGPPDLRLSSVGAINPALHQSHLTPARYQALTPPMQTCGLPTRTHASNPARDASQLVRTSWG